MSDVPVTHYLLRLAQNTSGNTLSQVPLRHKWKPGLNAYLVVQYYAWLCVHECFSITCTYIINYLYCFLLVWRFYCTL